MEALFTFLFKYRPLLFREGDFRFAASWPVGLMLFVAAALAVLALVTYVRPKAKAGRRDRIIMGVIRVGIMAVLLFCLFRPTLVLTSVVPQRNFVGVLVDDSRSMGLPAEDEEPRSAWVADELGAEGGDLLEALQERFAVRLFSFSSETSRIETVGELEYQGTRTDLTGALDRVREELSSVPLSGLVVVTDGADNAGRALSEALVPLQAASVPVFTVGLGEETLSPDVQVGRVEAPRRVLQGTSLIVDVVVSQRGYGGETVPLIVEDDTRILAEEDVEFGNDDEPTVVRVRFTLEEPGPHRVRFRVPVQEREAVDRNNERMVLMEVRPEREKILYFEGEPRFEVKFIKRAVRDDENIQVVLLQRTAQNKFLRVDVDRPEELEGGFPKSRAELFQYTGLILGSVEASFFSHDQLEMIADFVSQRGGGLLTLGGRRSYAEGGYAGTPVEDVLPVYLDEPASDPHAAYTELIVRPTRAGEGHAATQIRPGEEATAAWDSLPALSILNHITRVKPGATPLLVGETPRGEERVVLAHQRFGRGKSLALTVQDTWMWQMHYDIALEDQTSENLWRQLLRWLVDGVPSPVDARTELERAEPEQPVRIIVEVNDSAYLRVNEAVVTASITRPDGSVEEQVMDWTVERDGEYAATFTPTLPGGYQILVAAEGPGGRVYGASAAWVDVGPSDEEYFDAAQRRETLERLAEQTGGIYYAKDEVSSLAEDIQFTGAGVTLTEERDLWDMPVLLLALIMLMGAEWAFRRTRGLV